VVTRNLATEIFLLVIEIVVTKIVVMEKIVKIETLAMKKFVATEKGGNQK
jgi:hypothetical protein